MFPVSQKVLRPPQAVTLGASEVTFRSQLRRRYGRHRWRARRAGGGGAVAQSLAGDLPAELAGWPVLPASAELLADLELALGGSGVSGDGGLRSAPGSP